jgi:flagellar M-ring protein FliF
MKADPKDPIARARERWQGFYGALDAGARKRLWTGAAVGSLLLGGLVLLLGRTNWTILYSDLEARDAGAITEKLKAGKVPYRLAKNGTEIEVPAAVVSEERLQLAAQGLPQGQSKGFEMMDQGNNLLMSDEASKLNRQRALQGELERSVMSLRGVEAVRVHLVVPEQRLFSKDAQPSSASILIKMQPGMQLGDQEALSISYLVSHAVEGLKPENVAIVDTEGHDLGLTSPGGGAQMGTRIESQRKVERQLAGQVQSLLDEALGPDKAIVRVHAELDFSSQNIVREEYEAPGADKKTGLIREESSNSAQDTAPSVGSANSTLAGNTGAQVVGGQGKGSTRTDRKVTYELNKTVSQITQGEGALKRVSVSVLLKEALAPAELAALNDAVAKTVGLDASRGDSMSLAVVPAQALVAAQTQAKKQDEAMTKATHEEAQTVMAATVAPWALAGLVVLALFALGWRALRLSGPAGKEGAVRARAGAANAGDAGQAPAQPVSIEAPLPASEEELRRLIERYPSSAAQVLRRMMTN